MNRLPLGVLAALITFVTATPAGAAAAPRPLRNTDVRKADGGPVTPSERRARSALERSLGDEGVVSTDRISGGARMVARTDGFLTRRDAAPAASVALQYVRVHPEVFGIGAPDLADLRLTRRYESAGGVTHLAWTQTYAGVASYDNVLLANVDGDGRLLNIGGSAVSGLRVGSVVPDIAASAALASARRETGGALIAPRARQGRGPERPTSFAGGDRARLALFNDGATTRLAWVVQVTGAHGWAYEVVVDASSGATLKRSSDTEFAVNANVFDNYPGAPQGGTAATRDLTGPPADPWLSAAPTALSGNNAHAYPDIDATNGFTPPPGGSDVEVTPNPGPNFVFPQTLFGTAPPCPASGCTWNSSTPATRATNRKQAATQLFYYVNVFHDHLKAAPIGFDAASGNFEGTDPVLAESDNYNNPDGTSPPPSVDNANMTTPRDGFSPRLQAFLFTSPALNSTDTADVIYHEYTHGLSNRLVGSGVGLDANQSRAMGEGWSDWYALDFLDLENLRPDSGGANGDMTLGAYLLPGGFRTQAADCPVGATAPACPGTTGAGAGGYTLGDMGHILPGGFEVHADGEIWLETLWDIRSSAIGNTRSERLITEGLRLAPNNPSFLEARDAIILADRAVNGGANADTLWAIFANRGMGYSATTTSGDATTATEAVDLPPRLVHDTTTVTDPAPGGNGDDVPQPGETVMVTEALRNAYATPTTAISGTLSRVTPGLTVGVPGPLSWPDIPAGAAASNATPFEATIPAAASCDATMQLNLAVTSTPGGTFDVPLSIPLGSKRSTAVPRDIPPTGATTSALTFNGSGTVHGLEVHIGRLAHTWVGDLVVKLKSPAGTEITLMNQPGPTADGANGNDFVDLVLDDDAPTAIDAIPATNPPGGYTGRFRPDSPLAAFDGQDWAGTWTLTIQDVFPDQDSGTLFDWSIRPSGVAPCNRPPIALDDGASVAGGQTLHGASVLANDSDPDGDPITAVDPSAPAHGSLGLNADGTFTYQPQAGFKGTDSFTYRASDGTAQSAPATVTLSVGNQPPTATDDAYDATSGATLEGASVLANDSDPNGDALTATLTSGPAHGTLQFAPGGTFTYTPDAGFTGRDAFTYSAGDGLLASAPATATITVAGVPVAPPPPPPPPPVPPPAPVPPPPAAPVTRAPAKLQVQRAGVSAGKLDVLASITSLATGNVRVDYRSAGATTSFDAPVRAGRIRFRRTLAGAQRSKPTGIFTLTYAGSPRVQPDSVTLRAARGKAQLVRTASRIDAAGRLHVAGTISPRARGIVRVRLGYDAGGRDATFLDYRAKIHGGAWLLVQQLPAAAAKAGGQLSIQFTGYERLRIRGEQLAKEVARGG